MQFLGPISGRWCDIITMNSLELSSNLYNYVGQFKSLGTLPVHHHRGVGNEQFWCTRFPDFSLISL